MMLHYQKRTIIAQSRLLVVGDDEHEAVAHLGGKDGCVIMPVPVADTGSLYYIQKYSGKKMK